MYGAMLFCVCLISNVCSHLCQTACSIKVFSGWSIKQGILLDDVLGAEDVDTKTEQKGRGRVEEKQQF